MIRLTLLLTSCLALLSGTLKADNDLSALYPSPHHLLWLDQQQLSEQGEQALLFLESADKHGLNPARYQYEQLSRLHSQLDTETQHAYDQMLTTAVLALLTDLARGSIEPLQADPHWQIPRDPFDPIAFLHKARQKQDLLTTLKEAAPAHTHYQTLKQALQHYRQLSPWQPIETQTTLRSGDIDPAVNAIRARLLAENPHLEIHQHSEVFDETLADAVRRFQQRYHLEADGIVGKQTRAAMNLPLEHRIDQIRLNMERHRWLPHDPAERYIMVNLAGFGLIAVEKQQIKLDMRVIVGQLKRQTPGFVSEMTHIVFNPFWHVPSSLARRDVLPRQQRDPEYLEKYGFQVFESIEGDRREVDIKSLDWSVFSPNYFPYALRQRPGPLNALGTMKFMFPNPWSIYLHDTPDRQLFSRAQRNFSAGCIRVEDPHALAVFSLNEPSAEQWIDDILASGRNTGRMLKQTLPVYAVYFTVWPEQGQIKFADDHYQRDKPMAKLLNSLHN